MTGRFQSINGFSAKQIEYYYSKTGCSDPGLLRLNHRMLRRFHPEWFDSVWARIFRSRENTDRNATRINMVRSQLLLGDRSPAIVVSESPLYVAAYSEEQDGIVMLEFASDAVPEQLVKIGTNLVTLNFDYSTKFGSLARDLAPGPSSSRRWVNFLPLIGDFLSADHGRLRELRESIPGEWWKRLHAMAARYDFGNGVRDGRPEFAAQPGIGDAIWKLEDRGH